MDYSPRDSVGYGFVIIPNDIDRESYILQCSRTGTVSILTGNNEVVSNCPVSTLVVKELVYPLNAGELGSQVCFVNLDKHNTPIIIAVILKTDEISQDSDKTIHEGKRSIYGETHIIQDVRSGAYLGLKVASPIKDRGKLSFESTAPDNTGEIEFKSNGKVKAQSKHFEVDVDSSVSLKVNDGSKTLFEVFIENGVAKIQNEKNLIKLSESEIIIKGESIVIQDGKYLAVLGELLKAELEKNTLRLTTLIQAIKAAPIVPSDGGASFKASIIAATSTLQSEDYSQILSKTIKIS